MHRFNRQPDQELPVHNRHNITVCWTGEQYRITDGEDDDFELSAIYTVENLYKRMHRRALANLPDHVGVRAVTGVLGNRAFLIVGGKGSGKSILAVRMMLEGYQITGDELALLHDGEVVPFPRRFMLPGDGIALVPELQGFDEFADFMATDRTRLIPIDPQSLGKPWRIAPLAVSTILAVERNFGSRSAAWPCGKLDMSRRMLPQCNRTSAGGELIRELSRTIDTARTFVLSLGDLNSAIAVIKNVLPIHIPYSQ